MIRLDIPDSAAARSNCEAILRWPIFRGYAPETESFILELEDGDAEPSHRSQPLRSRNLGRGVQEDDFTVLSKKFLAYVHVKNPVLDVSDFKAYVKDTVENGPRWDGPSCLVVSSRAVL